MECSEGLVLGNCVFVWRVYICFVDLLMFV